MFNLFKRKKVEENFGLRTFLVDNLYYITTLDNFEKVESNKFRLATSNNAIQLSISNYSTKENIGTIDHEYMKRFIPMYNSYVGEGGFEPINQLKIENDFISQAFQVGEETQYYLTTVKKLKDCFVTSNMIIRSFDTYNEIVESILESVYDSIEEK